MVTHRSFKGRNHLLLALILAANAQAAVTDISTVPLNTYSATSSADVKPNVFFVLDDSGSMDSDYLPDWATSRSTDYRFRNSAYNGVAYNPGIRYRPPVTYDSTGALNTTAYPSMTGTSAATGGDASATTGSPNWKAVPNDGYKVQSTGTTNLVDNAFSYTVIPGEYCTSNSMRTCTTATGPSASYPIPAKVRWCSDTALTTCRATNDGTYSNLRMPSPRSAILTVGASTSSDVTSITVNSQEILSATATASSTASTFAQNISTQINLCSKGIPAGSQCTVVGYTSTVSGSTVTIFAPGAIAYTPMVTQSGTTTVSATAFSSGTIPGENLRTTITSTVTSYSYPGTNAKGVKRTDCAGTTCTYAEEMTNYANWWAYYHTRMQMMKTAASDAFSKLDTANDVTNNVSRFRVGYMTISNNDTYSDFLNLGEFKTSQKHNWYTKLFAANPSPATPLRAALSRAGQLYAGKLNGTTINGVTVTDPLQYSCQQNYTILSTDGFWNTNDETTSYGPFKMDNSTLVGNQDAGLPRPLYDGGSAQVQASTSTLQSQTSQLMSSTSQLQTRSSTVQAQTTQKQSSTSSLQISTADLQISTSTDSGNTWSAWSTTTSCTWDTSTSSRTKCQYLAYTTPVNASSCTSRAKGTSTQGGTKWSGPATNCTYTVWTAYADANSCTPLAQSTGSPYTVGTAVRCQSVVSSPYADATSCTATTTPNGSGQTTQCRYTAWSAWVDATATCTAVAQSTSGTYNPTATQCQYAPATTPTPVASCTSAPQSTASPYTQLVATTCSYGAYSTWSGASSCTAVPKSTGSPYTVGVATNCQYSAWSSWSNVSSCTAVAQSSSPNYTVATARQCQSLPSGGTSNTLADVAAYYYGTDLRSPDTTQGTGTCTGPVISPSTTANDLCNDTVQPHGRDVATTQHMVTFTLGLGAQGEMVYSPDYLDATNHFNSALTSGDFYDVWRGTTTDTANAICSWQTTGACNWPSPSSGSLKNIDDLWHAALNGRGSYYSATDPETLSQGLSGTLGAIINTPKPGTAAAAASSNPNVSASDNYVFSSSYKSVEWYGELIRQQLDPQSSTLSPVQWSAMTLLDCATTSWRANVAYVAGNTYTHGGTCYQVAVAYTSGASFGTTDTTNSNIIVDAGGTNVVPLTSRNIYTKGTSGLISFDWNSLSGTQQGYFTAPAITYVSTTPNVVGLSQFCSAGACLTTTEQSNTTIATGGAAGEALVNFLRGDRSNEGTYYRIRTHVLGDIVASEGRYVKQPLFSYADAGYGAYQTAQATRSGAVYVAANDGMLHSFAADTGQESWAYIPGLVLPDMYKLADMNYSSQHQFLVDGTPEVGEICPNAPGATCDSTQWKTILVGGLNRGGKGYYALDITNPASPVLLWEISSATTGFSNLGYTYGNAKITKLKDGTWVVMFTSGYNNADGVGYLYIVNADTGSLIRTISTGTGSAASPSGLSRIAAHAPQSQTDNTTVAVYGGDLLGNLWRFDVNGDIGAAGYDAQLLVTLKDASGNPQPITAKPTVASINGTPVVYIGTGRFLGVGDISDNSQQSFYGIKDQLGTTTYSNPHASGSGFVQQTLTGRTCPPGTPASVCSPSQQVRTVTSNFVDWSTQNGWYLDFITGGERSYTDSSLGLGTLVFTTVTPQTANADPCGSSSGSGASFAYSLDYLTGGAVAGSNGVAAGSLGSGIATRPVLIRLIDGTIIELIRKSGGDRQLYGDAAASGGTTTSGGEDMGDTQVVKPPIKQLNAGGTRRSSWRQLQ